jgi:hypothetical protein
VRVFSASIGLELSEYEVACKVQLHATSKIHLVMHVSQLKKTLPPQTETTHDGLMNNSKSLLWIRATQHVRYSDTLLCKVGRFVTSYSLVHCLSEDLGNLG